MVVVDDVVVVMVWMVLLLWGCGSARLLLLVSLLLLLLHEVELVIPFAVQALSLSLFALAFPLPLTFFAVCPSLFPIPFASRFFGGWDPFINRDDSRSRHPAIRRFQNPVGIDVYGGYRSRGCKTTRVR